MNALYEIIGILKIFFCFHRKTNDHICGKCRISQIFSQKPAFLCIFCASVSAIHSLQCGITSALQGQMEMRTHFRQCGNALHKFFCDDSRFQEPRRIRSIPSTSCTARIRKAVFLSLLPGNLHHKSLNEFLSERLPCILLLQVHEPHPLHARSYGF